MLAARQIAVLAALVIAAAATFGAEAKMVVDPKCQWFGTRPLCAGKCPKDWTQKKRESCTTGSRVYCCDFQEKCVPEVAAGWKPGATRTRDDGVIECQQCKRWGDDCRRGGHSRFNTACANYEWVPCGRGQAKPKKTTGGTDIGLPERVPESQPSQPAPPPCDPPKERYPNGACACPKGLTGEFCNFPVVN